MEGIERWFENPEFKDGIKLYDELGNNDSLK